MKIGYIPHSENLSHPGDRRRIVSWARARGYELIVNPKENVDALFVCGLGNTMRWRKRYNGPIVLDVVDGYLNEEPIFLEDAGRNLLRFCKGQTSLKKLRYTSELMACMNVVDAVVVSSTEQRLKIQNLNKNVFDILDNHEELLPKEKMSLDFSSRAIKEVPFSILWEGFGYTLKYLFRFAPEIDSFLAQTGSRLTILSQRRVPRISTNLWYSETKNLLKRNFPRSIQNIIFLDWSIQNLMNTALISDVAIIPLPKDDKFVNAKPENKVLSFWTLRIPTLCSPIPSYERVAKSAGLTENLVENDSWAEALNNARGQKAKLKQSLVRQDYYLREFHNSSLLHTKWDRVLDAILQ